MISGKDILVLSDDWGRHPCSCQHLITQLLKGNRVLWVNTIGYRKLTLTAYDIKRSFQKISSWFTPQIEASTGATGKLYIPDNLRVINAVCLPYGEYKAVRIFNRIMISRLVRNHCHKLKFADPLLITTLPTAENIIGRLGEAFSVYYCVDDFSLWPGSEAKLIYNLEKQLLPQVDLIVATSEKLAHTRQTDHRETKLLTHGVDIDHFSSIKKMSPPAELKKLSQPVVAYYGLIDERCDLNMLAELAKRMPKVTFLIIGSWRVNSSPVDTLPNVHITGKVAYEELPSYLSEVSALILPYKLNDLTESVNPLKLKEYLSTGLQVVATPLPEVVKLDKYVHCATNCIEFKTALEKILTDKNRPAHSDLQKYLLGESWAAKTEQLSHYITRRMSTSTGK